MSLIDRYAAFVAEHLKNDKKTNKEIVWKIFDPNYATPDIFYMMDEVGGKQILRKYDKSAGMPEYVGTYQVLFKTTDLERFCLIMKRIENEWPVARGYAEVHDKDVDSYVVAEYYPGSRCLCTRVGYVV